MNDILDSIKKKKKKQGTLPVLMTLAAEIYPKVIEYRETQAKKYNAEAESDYSNYGTAEIYKNRTRVIDTFLGPVENLLIAYGKIEEPANVTIIP